MSKYTGPTFKLSRRLGFSILETGKEFSKGKKRTYGPGQHGMAGMRKKHSNYGLQLKEKQKVRFMYGVSEKQFRKTYIKATKMVGITSDNFLALLESRLDNLVYRFNLAPTRQAARQLVNHGHILLNGQKADIPSISVKPGEIISVKETAKNLKIIKASLANKKILKDFIKFDKNILEGTFERLPEINELNQEIKYPLIVEWYNRFI